MHNIVIVEDESIVAMEIEGYVTTLGYAVQGIYSSAGEVIAAIDTLDVEIVLMDINLSGERDGIEAAEAILKKRSEIEVIFLTAHMDSYNIDRAVALHPAAYLQKPFRREELQAFLKIAGSRYSEKQQKMSISLPEAFIRLTDAFAYDMKGHTLYRHGYPIHLTKKEIQLLELLIRHANQVVDIYTLGNELWYEKVTTQNTLRTLIKRLREKMCYQCIETIPAVGYRLYIVPQENV